MVFLSFINYYYIDMNDIAKEVTIKITFTIFHNKLF